MAQNRQVYQWNQIKCPAVNPHTNGHLIFDEESRNIQWQNKAPSTNSAGQTGHQHVEECTQIHIYLLNKIQIQVDPKPQHKIRYTDSERRENRE